MKKINLLVIALLFGALAVNANPVDVTVAKKVATTFYATRHSNIAPTLSLAYTERDANGLPVYYVFNVNSTEGFVIICAEDAAHPVLGYSTEGAFVIPATNNNNVSFWLQRRKTEIISLRKNQVSASTDVNDEWVSYSAGRQPKRFMHTATPVVGPLVQTRWNQSPFYNYMCPGNSVTGCVATAMAQILRYWSYPSVGTGSNCYYDEQSQGYSENYGQLCAYFDTSHYVWSGMPNQIGRNNAEIAKLMYDCGVSVDMDYTPTGSGSNVISNWGPSAYNSYTQYFGYDATTINSAMYSHYTDPNWIALLENELNNHRPMQFQGFDATQGGHSWVCDGYDNQNYMHMNWGWGGMSDGYFSVDSLNPSPLDFTQQIGIVYGIQPPAGALGVSKISENTAITVYPNPSHGVFNFTISNSNSYQVRIYNVLGQEVTATVLNEASNAINLSNQCRGVYIYKLMTQTGSPVSTGRLIVE